MIPEEKRWPTPLLPNDMRIRGPMLRSGQIVPGEPGPRLMTTEQIQAWKAKLLRLGAWTPKLLRITPKEAQ